MITGTGKGPLPVGKNTVAHPALAARLVKKGFAKEVAERPKKDE